MHQPSQIYLLPELLTRARTRRPRDEGLRPARRVVISVRRAQTNQLGAG